MRDTNLIFHDGTTFTSTVTPASTTRANGSAVLDIGKSGEGGLWLQLANIAAITGTSPTVDAKVQYSDSATFASGIENGPAFPQITNATAAGYRRSILCQSKRRYWRVLLTAGGTITATNIEAYIVSGPDRDDNA
jgi:hypothetical protein